MGWSLSGFQAVLQLSLFDGVAFDPFPFQENGLAYAEASGTVRVWVCCNNSYFCLGRPLVRV
jgi:hypothetical protein